MSSYNNAEPEPETYNPFLWLWAGHWKSHPRVIFALVWFNALIIGSALAIGTQDDNMTVMNILAGNWLSFLFICGCITGIILCIGIDYNLTPEKDRETYGMGY